ncbi:MAG: NAD-binding protein [Desulfurococcales archaeon]|nr:NAD-binding protein [Desulfurococcales archaeon]
MKPEVVVIGLGNVGLRVLWQLSTQGHKALGIDRNGRAVERARRLGLEAKVGDATSIDSLRSIMAGARLAATAVPGSLGLDVLRALSTLGVNVVDVSFFDPRRGRVEPGLGQAMVVDAGVAPGLSNMLLSMLVSRVRARNGAIYVGGISEEPQWPLGISATWNVEDLIEEYLRPARMISRGRIVEVDPLEAQPGHIEIEGVGRLEYFPTDGLRSLLETHSWMDELAEYTLRWPGHIDTMKRLRAMGLLSESQVRSDGCLVPARGFLAGLLKRRYSGVRDMLVMIVRAVGSRAAEARLVVRADEEWSAMAKATGGFQAAVADLMLRGEIHAKGLVYPEQLASMPGVSGRILEMLDRMGVRVVID